MKKHYNVVITGRSDAIGTYEKYLEQELSKIDKINFIYLPIISPTKIFGFENRLRTLWLYFCSFLSVIKAYKGGCIHFLSGTEKLSFLPLFYKFEYCILTSSHLGEDLSKDKFLNNWIIKKMFKTYNAIIAWTPQVKEDLVTKYGVSSDKIRVIELGCDLSYFKPTPSKNLELLEPYILFVGTEKKRKNFTNLLKAFKIVLKSYPKLKLVKIGRAINSNNRKKTLTLIDELGIRDNVLFMPDEVELNDMSNYYSNAQMFVFPSFLEGFGFPIIEAMACGCPVITSNIEPMKSLTGGTQITVDPYSIDEIAVAIVELLENPNKCAQMSRKGLVEAQKYNWSEIALKTKAVYDQVML